MRRLAIGQLPGGAIGMRATRAGFDLDNPAAPLLFDSDTPILSVLFRAAQVAQWDRVVRTEPPFFGFPGNTVTYFASQSTFTFPYALPFAPVCRIGFTTSIGGQRRSYDEAVQDIRYSSTTTGVTVTVSQQYHGDVRYDSAPVHRVSVLNLPVP